MAKRVKWTVEESDGYVRVIHSQRGVIVAARVVDGRATDVTLLNEADRRNNFIRQPAMVHLANWERRKASVTAMTQSGELQKALNG